MIADQSQTDAATPPADRRSSHVGIVCSTSQEARAATSLLDRLKSYRDGQLQFRGGIFEEVLRVAVVEAGGEYAAHRTASEILLREHRPRWVMSIGFCTSLSPEADNIPLFAATSVTDTHGQSLDLRNPVRDGLEHTAGTLLTTDSRLRTADEREAASQDLDALVSDAVGMAVVQVCAENNMNCYVFRSVLDHFREELPDSLMATACNGSAEPSGLLQRLLPRRTPSPWRERIRAARERQSELLFGLFRSMRDKVDTGGFF